MSGQDMIPTGGNLFDLSALTAAVQLGKATHRQAIAVYASLFGSSVDAPPLVLPCEECGALVPLSHIVSYKLWVAMPGHPAVAAFDEHGQHYCCSHDCAEKQVSACLSGHLRPEAERRCAEAIAVDATPSQAPEGTQAS